MNLIDYGRILIRRGWIALLLAVLTAVAALLFSQLITPVYRATQTILIVPSRSDFGLTQAAVQLLNNRRAYLDSDLIAQKVIDRLRLDYTPQYLRGQTTIAANRENLTIQIDVDLPVETPEEAARLIAPIAAAWGQELIDYQEELNQSAQREDRIRAQPQDNPRVALLRPNASINAAIGAIAGLFLGFVLIFVLEYIESNIIRRAEDVEQGTSLKLLAVVPTE